MTRPTTLTLHDFSDESFIHGCYISDHICDDLIKYFDEHPDRQISGKLHDVKGGSVVDVSKKESTDISFFSGIEQSRTQLRNGAADSRVFF